MIGLMIGNKLSYLFMPAQWMFSGNNKARDNFEAFVNSLGNRVPHTELLLDSTGGATISCVEFHDSNRNQAQKCIIHLYGNGDCYEQHAQELSSKAYNKPNVKVVAFNCRNIQKSTGQADKEQDWYDDAKAVLRHYMETFAPEDILIHGHSMGGAISTIAAAQIYQEDRRAAEDGDLVKSVRVINDRSFSSLVDVVLVLLPQILFIGAAIGGVISLLLAPVIGLSTLQLVLFSAAGLNAQVPSLFKPLFRPFVHALLASTFGVMDAARAFLSLPADARCYVVAENDGVIPETGRMHDAVNEKRLERIHELKQEFGDDNSEALELDDVILEGQTNTHMLPLQYLQTKNPKRQDQITGTRVVQNATNRMLRINA